MLLLLNVGTGKYGRLIVQNLFGDGQTEVRLTVLVSWPWPALLHA